MNHRVQEPCPPGHEPVVAGVWQRVWLLLVLGTALAVLLGWTHHRSVPVAVVEASQARLPCVSYAPYRRPGETPFDPTHRVTEAHIEADLRLLKPFTGCVRTYGASRGLEAVPLVARKLGMQVYLGAWIGRNSDENQAELASAILLSQQFPDVVRLLVVGNEVLLRKELTPPQLALLLAQAQAATQVAVAYADVWEFWVRHAAVLLPHVDVVAAHVLPYWEDEPVGATQAVDHVYGIAATLKNVFTPTPVLIAETGWPAAGRQRGPARPGVLEQATFVRALQARQATEPLDYNLIEGFDQPWKRALEGAMGGYWGLLGADGTARFALTGPVIPDPLARWWLAAAALGALAGLLVGRRSVWQAATLALSAAALATLGLVQGQALQVWSRGPLEWATGLAMLVLSCGLSSALALRLAQWMATGRAPPAPHWLRWCRCGFLFGTALMALGLVFDARYRPLDWPSLALPAVLLAALAWLGERTGQSDETDRETRFLAAVVGLCAPAIAWQEGVHNTEAHLVAALLAVLAVAVLWPQRGAARTSVKPASSTAGAESGTA